jgi:hypothetical protein
MNEGLTKDTLFHVQVSIVKIQGSPTEYLTELLLKPHNECSQKYIESLLLENAKLTAEIDKLEYENKMFWENTT